MKKLSELIECPYDLEIKGIATDSRNVEDGYLFIATKGYHVDHYLFIDDAIKHGAVAVVVDRVGSFSVPTVLVSDISQVLISICEKFYEVSSRDFSFVGITGTDGKTTTAMITRNLLNLYFPTAYIGTNGLYCGDDIYPTQNTTPCIEELYQAFSVVKKHNCKVIVMEVSSEALLHHRVDSILFDVVAFTNITEDHLNIHKSIENYRNCKFRLASLCKSNGNIFVNGDCENCQLLTVKCKISFGVNSDNDCVISNVSECKDFVKFTVCYQGEKYHFSSPFLGIYNIYNVVLAWLIAGSFSLPYDKLCLSISKLSVVPGRREVFHDKRGFDVLLDYAHTENAVFHLLKSLSHYSRIIVVTGAAGGREKRKRSLIGDVLFQYASYIVFTMDDPRYENPKKIAQDMIGTHNEKEYTFIEDRQNAISFAFQNAKKGDVVAVIGKGRDNYMAIYDKKLPYSDYDVIMNLLQQ